MNKVFSQLGEKIRFFDGAMGTVLQEKGLLPGELPELWNLSHREYGSPTTHLPPNLLRFLLI